VKQKLLAIQMLALTAVDLAITSAIVGCSWRGESRPLEPCQERKVERVEDFDWNARYVRLLKKINPYTSNQKAFLEDSKCEAHEI
jgi:hypothetical protein